MAKIHSDGILASSFFADEDLSSKQYFAVTAASTDEYVKAATGGSNPAPLGILQDGDGDVVGNVVAVKLFGATKAAVSACDVSGNACAIKYGTFLRAGSGGMLYAAGGGDAVSHARALEAMSSGCAILSVFFYGIIASCAVAAS